jgi:dTDP-glucose 4,6-dehydratase
MRLEDGRVVPNFVAQALRGEPLTIYGDGKQTRSFCYVDDLIEGIYRLLFSDEHEPVNLGNPIELSILEFAEVINRLTGNTAGVVYQPEKRIKDDPQTRQPDISKAKQLLGWEPKVPLEDGLRRTIEHFRTRI